jgi:hypothetical protein
MASGESWGEVELEPDVEARLLGLDEETFGQARFHIDMLAERGVHLGESHTRQLRGKLRELRMDRWRSTYFIAPGRRIVLLTVFLKRQRRERAEIDRAEQAMARCIEEHVGTDRTEG